jgi:hypothetical protein
MRDDPHVNTKWKNILAEDSQLHSSFSHFPHSLSLSRMKNKEGKDELEWESGEGDWMEEQAWKGKQDQPKSMDLSFTIFFMPWLAQELSPLVFLASTPKSSSYLHAWMDHGHWKFPHHLKSKIQSCYNSILSSFLKLSLSCGLMELLQGILKSLSWLGNKDAHGFIFIFGGKEPIKSQANLSWPISRICLRFIMIYGLIFYHIVHLITKIQTLAILSLVTYLSHLANIWYMQDAQLLSSKVESPSKSYEKLRA